MVRRTETRDFGLTAGWFEEDGTTTTYQPYARSVGAQRRVETGPVPRTAEERPVAPAHAYARRPSGVQPKVATPTDDFEVLDLDELDDPFAPRRSAASTSVWNVLGFAALFASVLIGRVVVEAGHSAHVHRSDPRTGAQQAPQPKAAIGATAAPARAGSPASTGSATRAESSATPDSATPAPAQGSGRVSSESATPALTPQSAQASSIPSAIAASEKRVSHGSATPALGAASSIKREPPNASAASTKSASTANSVAGVEANAPPRPAALSASSEANESVPHTRARARGAETRDWRDGPMEPATSSLTPPTAASASMGTLRINSRPWSQVFIDGRLIGNTPQMSLSVPAGRYTVRLTNPELGMSKTFIVHVPAGELVTRIESLQ